ncbi:PPOX class F420-dependent oxidoreductase [Candidatus Wolfebacteria bacterium]|nr:PPOX class F420-dependent oxidoreductase [Candidatus Wolfebacteria bacterium]
MTFQKNIEEFLREPNYMVLGTLGASGHPHMTIVWFEYNNGVFRISTTTPRVKYRNVTANPKVGLLIYDRGNPYRYVQVRGAVTDITKEGGHDFIDYLSGRYTGNAKYKYDPERKEDRVIITVMPERFFSVGFPQE